ncbi:hypothetical protein FE810_01575 [Thalassotalea litorea]|uniref:Uncharacterized protein n=1 Tax=Thalassotalea litorea TaxID=2020715 RepID=A0A5R9IT41_9GAMM|nr:hypothetical protein [Thalassotalea litorea]TLU67663.1 hypothetical protein FE810_01575 [Thalassotalea litorea]
MTLMLIFVSLLSGLFFYCQAIKSGLGYKRWTTAGLIFGPLVWPMFAMEKRLVIYRQHGNFFSLIYV